METYRQTNDNSETDSDNTDIFGSVFEREAAESDDYSHIVQPCRFEPYHAMPDGVDSAIAADDATRINMARCGENVICQQTNDDSDTSVHDTYISP